MSNPFADYGGIVTGQRFIGRKKELYEIQNRVLGETYGNIAIMGLPRVGKSSLAWNAVLENESDLVKKQIIPIRINMGDLSDSNNYFLKIIYDLDSKIEDINKFDRNKYKKLVQELSVNNLRLIERNRYIQKYFKTLKQDKYRVVFILDEFDAVRKYFKLEDFQFLRELAYNPETKICLITISRRTLKEIEPRNNEVLSNFYQIFTDLYLGMYTRDDLNEYWDKFFDNGTEIREEDKQNILRIAGKHPFLLDMFNFHVFNNLKDNLSQAISETKIKIKLTILNNYKTIIELLREENLDSKLLQMVLGPVYDITATDAEKIERYGLVYTENGNYKGFSEDFNNYLNIVRREVSIWNLWSETEVRLREVVFIFLKEKFGENWVEKFKKLQNKEKIISDLEELQKREEKTFGERASKNLLDFTYPADLFNHFMTTDWSWFSRIFGKDKAEWSLKFGLLAKIRNPLAHNKTNILKDFERNNAAGYCQEIIARIDKWNRTIQV